MPLRIGWRLRGRQGRLSKHVSSVIRFYFTSSWSWWCWCIAAQVSVLDLPLRVVGFAPQNSPCLQLYSKGCTPVIFLAGPRHCRMPPWALDRRHFMDGAWRNPLLHFSRSTAAITASHHASEPACSFPLSSAASPSPVAPFPCRRPQLQPVDWGLQMSFWGRFSQMREQICGLSICGKVNWSDAWMYLEEDDLRMNPSLPFASDKHRINRLIGISITKKHDHTKGIYQQTYTDSNDELLYETKF